MRLFKRKKQSGAVCPRCTQVVAEDEGLVCPMCGWDLRDVYQGPTQAPAAAVAVGAPTNEHPH
jgi:uncharacterized paraquat-inducible protein A